MEIYALKYRDGRICFDPADISLPPEALDARFSPDLPDKDLLLAARMGDPDLVHAIIYKYNGKPGGVFSVHDKNGLLFAAVADTNLAFAMAQGLFGEMTANARYGVDVFENLEEPDD